MVFELFHCPTNPTSKIITWACLVRNAAPSYWGLLSRLRPTRGLSSFTPRPSWVQKQLWDNHEGTCSQRRLLPSHCQEAGLFLWDLLLVPKCTLFCLEWLDYFNGVNAVPSHNLGWACAAQFSRSWVSSLFGARGSRFRRDVNSCFLLIQLKPLVMFSHIPVPKPSTPCK